MKVLFLILLFLVLCPAFYFYCIMPRFTRKEQTKRFAHQLFAHRGLFNPKLGIPENSMPAVSRAIEKGYGIELDVQVTKDNPIIPLAGCVELIFRLKPKLMQNYRSSAFRIPGKPFLF